MQTRSSNWPHALRQNALTGSVREALRGAASMPGCPNPAVAPATFAQRLSAACGKRGVTPLFLAILLKAINSQHRGADAPSITSTRTRREWEREMGKSWLPLKDEPLR